MPCTRTPRERRGFILELTGAESVIANVTSKACVEHIVAIKVVEESGRDHFFLTWGRIFDPVEPESLLAALRPNLPGWGVHQSCSLEVCYSLQDAASQPYFYEALFMMAQERIPLGPKYESWQASKRKRIRKGKDVWYLGKKT